MNDDQRGLLYLFERPFEPLNAPRGRPGQEIIFQKEGEEVEDTATRFGPSCTLMTIPSNIPDIMNEMQMVKQIPKGVPFSQFDPLHLAAADELTQQFMDPKIAANLWQLAASIKDIVNEELFIYALSFTIIRNPALDSRFIPPIYEVFPNKFIPQDIMQLAKEKLETEDSLTEEIVVSHNIDFTGTDLDPELHLKYWREDYGINSHHWHWHLVFPGGAKRDRKGEIFFYMHSQMLARYDWERLSNGLDCVVGLDNWSEPIPEGYEHKLQNYGNRKPNTELQNVGSIDISEMETWRESFFDAIDQGRMIKVENDEPQLLSDNLAPGEEKRGIDYLGDALEPDWRLSVNSSVYGNLHNDGHILIANIHEGELGGVMGDPTTALRDPVFYRWHKFVDDVFQKYKVKQVPYEDEELIFDSVNVESLSVKSDGNDDNVLETNMDYRRVDASRGLDFRSRDMPVMFDLDHLTHTPFHYNIQVANNETDPVDVTVRLYMAPKLNEAGEPMTFMDQRLLWAEMDRYHTKLEPGLNSLERLSTESSITIPVERTFRDLEENPPEEDLTSAFCGCGWPQHLLLPKGNAGGMDFQIFVLISDWKLDKVEVEGSAGKKPCSNAASFCGILNEKYPDARPMGYPFDRKPNETINNATDFSHALPNALMSDIKIFFRG